MFYTHALSALYIVSVRHNKTIITNVKAAITRKRRSNIIVIDFNAKM
jgi:hypothetical protein